MKKIAKYFRKRKKNILSLLTVQRSKYTPETFHGLRVEIKKIRSVLALLNYSADDFKRKKLERPFEQLFKQAGIIREIHVEEDMLEKYFSIEFLQEYRRRLRERNSEELQKYRTMVVKLEAVVYKSFEKMEPWIWQVNKKKIGTFTDRRRSKIQVLLNADEIQPYQIHLLRKRIKQYDYALKFAPEKITPLNDLDLLADLSGRWHDQRVLLNHLDRQFQNTGVESIEAEEIKRIRDEQMTLNNITFNEIKATIKRLPLKDSNFQNHS